MRSESPERRLEAEVLLELPRPHDPAVGGIEAMDVTLGAEREDLSIARDRRGARAGVVAHAVGRVVSVLPERLARLLVEAQHALAARDDAQVERVLLVHLRARGDLAIHDEHPPARDGRARKAGIDRSAPTDFQAARGELLDDAGLAPHGVALRAEPLRPVVRTHCHGGGEQSGCGEKRGMDGTIAVHGAVVGERAPAGNAAQRGQSNSILGFKPRNTPKTRKEEKGTGGD